MPKSLLRRSKTFLLKLVQALAYAWRKLSKPAVWHRARYKKLSLAQKALSWLYSGFLLLFLGVIALEINFLWLFGPMPSMGEVQRAEMSQASEIYAADGHLLGKYYTENRSPVPYDSIQPLLIKTLIAVEDVRFYQHMGIDFKAIGAALRDATRGQARGASTITQQLAKNLFQTRTDGIGLLGKVPGVSVLLAKAKEWITALKLELFFSKEEILALYLNTVDFGRNSFGIKSAAKTYFNKTPIELQPEECAILVGMLKAPTYYNPVANPKNSLRRRNVVLQLMEAQGLISVKQYVQLSENPIRLQYKEEEITDGLAPYFRSELAKWLRDYLKKNYGDKYNIYTSGLRIETTLDTRLQVHGEAAVGQGMRRLQRRFEEHWQGRIPWELPSGKEDTVWFKTLVERTDRYKAAQKAGLAEADIWQQLSVPVEMELFDWKGSKRVKMSPLDSLRHDLKMLQCGLVAVDPFTGQIRMWVGGINFRHYKYDHVKQMRRQPGSTFKPFVYAAAIEQGRGPCDKLVDKPVTVVYQENGEQKRWSPRNADWEFTYSEYTLRRGMAKSVNTIAAQLTEIVGPEAVVDIAKRLGIESPLEPLPAIGLGASDVSLLEMAGAYAAFMNKGEWIEPHFISRVFDRNGKLIFEYKPERRQAITPETAYLMTYMLRGGTEEAGGTSQALFEFDIFQANNQIGGKTGTSQSYSDGWFLGMTKELVVGSWVGADQRKVRFRTSQTGEGSKTALPIAGKFLELAYKDVLKTGPFPAATVKITKPHNCRTVVKQQMPDSLEVLEEADPVLLETPLGGELVTPSPTP
jgi:penicillin-binding protein 1A